MFILLEYSSLRLIYCIIIACFFLFFLTLFSIITFSNSFVYIFLLNEVLIFLMIVQFLVTGFLYDNLESQLFILILLVVSSCEVVIGLSLIVFAQQLSLSTGLTNRKVVFKNGLLS